MKSRPVYEVLAIRENCGHHTFVSSAQGAMAVRRVLDETVWSGTSIRVLNAEGGAGAFYGDLLDGHAGVALEKFHDVEQLVAAVGTVLERIPAGAHIYVSGPEGFLWRVYQVLRSHGIARDQVSMELLGSRARRVTCVHCKTMNEGVTTNPHCCAGCGQWLLVRDHFSRLMAAYVGVRIDAEEHGVVPEPGEVFS